LDFEIAIQRCREYPSSSVSLNYGVPLLEANQDRTGRDPDNSAEERNWTCRGHARKARGMDAPSQLEQVGQVTLVRAACLVCLILGIDLVKYPFVEEVIVA